MSHRLRNIRPRRAIRPRGAVIVAVLTLTVLATSGCGQSKSESMKLGDCGYFTRGQANRPFELEHRSCTDPEAALVVVREASTVRCPDYAFSRSNRGGANKASYVCTQLNAQIGDCFNNLRYRDFDVFDLRKVPCSTPGAYQVNTRVERLDYTVCNTANSKYGETAEIRHTQPPVSFCSHRIGT
ncbi:hypothetical protein OHA40_06195 [Nocardia sp. NBC_00508]|uniref:hypothetical protein n=1 Tax=Nocardia sp. NBC_00508 TaxID=2975992 RepID=UPI002E811CCB|nr:hypothetical protein [Nocardia sp. NBC_00508]WUD67717.1 hypothetical protein OHA40_06195 [Nocardia sp. NBC_00508]